MLFAAMTVAALVTGPADYNYDFTYNEGSAVIMVDQFDGDLDSVEIEIHANTGCLFFFENFASVPQVFAFGHTGTTFVSAPGIETSATSSLIGFTDPIEPGGEWMDFVTADDFAAAGTADTALWEGTGQVAVTLSLEVSNFVEISLGSGGADDNQAFGTVRITYIEAESLCDWDLDGDGDVGMVDLTELLGGYGTLYDFEDLIGLLDEWVRGCG